MAKSHKGQGFDLGARSLLAWGVVSGIFYLVVGVAQGLLRDGFSFVEYPLSVLMLGDLGWIQKANLTLSGLMVIAAAVGFQRTMKPDKRAVRTGMALGTYGLALIGAGVFPPDPVDGFPEAGSTAEVTTSGIMHLAFGGVGFIALAMTAFFMVGWFRERNEVSPARRARLAGLVILGGFLGGAALATSIIGVALLWMAVLAGWIWLALTSRRLYRIVAHPVPVMRQAVAHNAAGG